MIFSNLPSLERSTRLVQDRCGIAIDVECILVWTGHTSYSRDLASLVKGGSRKYKQCEAS